MMKIVSSLSSAALVVAISLPNWQSAYEAPRFATQNETAAQLTAAKLAQFQFRTAVDTAVDLYCFGDPDRCSL